MHGTDKGHHCLLRLQLKPKSRKQPSLRLQVHGMRPNVASDAQDLGIRVYQFTNRGFEIVAGWTRARSGRCLELDAVHEVHTRSIGCGDNNQESEQSMRDRFWCCGSRARSRRCLWSWMRRMRCRSAAQWLPWASLQPDGALELPYEFVVATIP